MSTFGQQLASKIDEVFAAEAEKTEDGLRRHLGASQIGEPCMRRLWFAFHWVAVEKFDGRMLRLFETGQLYEERFTKLLQLVGATVYTQDKDGKQFQVKAHGGHFGGSCDGVTVNLPYSSKPTLVEMKTWKASNFLKLVSTSVHNAAPKHVRQAQVYMHLLKLEKCCYIAVNKDTDELHIEFFNYDPELAGRMLERAEHIIFNGMPIRISDSSSWWECRYCTFKLQCHEKAKALVNCRTCQHSTPLRTGGWECAKGRSEIGTQPKVGCELHEYLPELI